MGCMEDALREGKLRIREHCACGWFYLSGPDRARQVIYTIIDLKTEISMEAFEKALADIRERFPAARQFLLQIDDAYYFAEGGFAGDPCVYAEDREIGGGMNGFHSFDAAADGTRIILSTDHALMDGGALMEITNAFLAHYGFYAGACAADGLPESAARREMETDLFSLPCEGTYDPVSGLSDKAFQLSFAGEDLSSLLEISIPMEQVLSLCKSLGTSPAALFVLLLAEAVNQAEGAGRKEAVIASVPVDLRDVLKAGGHVRTAAFSVMVNIDEMEQEGRSFGEKAALVRSYIGKHRNARTAGGWIRFFKEYIGPVNRRLAMCGGRAGASEAYTFMLSYLRPSHDELYNGKYLTFAGISAPNDFCMLEYNGNFHLWLRPFRNGRILPAFAELCASNGLSTSLTGTKGASLVSRPPMISGDKLPPSVFVFVSPAYGHVNPMLPLIGELVRSGFMVRVYTGNIMRERVERTGAVCIGYDAFYEQAHAPEGAAFGFLRMFELAAVMDEMVETDVKVLKPRFALADTESLWGRLLAEKHGLKLVLSSATQIMNLFTISEDWLAFFKDLEPYEEEITASLTQLSKKGFPKHTLLSLLTPGADTDCVAYIPEELQGRFETIDRSRVFFAGCSRLLPRVQAAGEGSLTVGDVPGSSGETASGEKGKRSLVYVTLGTVSGRSPWFFRSCIAAFRGMETDVVMAVWNDVDIRALGKIPDNIRVVREADQERVLQEADAALFHAGLNTIADCLLSGVPMVVYPTAADQFGNAKRVVENGTGIRIEDYRPGTIREAVSRILTEPSYREKASRLGDRMRGMGGAKGAAAWILGRIGGAFGTKDRTGDVEAVYPFSAGMKNRFRLFGDVSWLGANLVYLYKEPDIESLKKRYRELVSKRQMLRAIPVFPAEGEPFTAVKRTSGEELFLLDISWMKDAEKQRQHLNSFVRSFRDDGFEKGTPAFRAGLVRIGTGRYMLLLIYSHYLLDAGGVQRVTEDLIHSHALTDDAPKVGSFYRRWELLSKAPETLAYWETYLAGVRGYTALPFLAAGSGESKMETIRASIDLNPLQAYGRRHHVMLSHLIHAALGDAILSLTGLEQVCLISTASERNEYLTDDERLTGMFAVEIPFVYRRGDTPELCRDTFLRHRQYVMFDFTLLGESFAGSGTLPQAVRCNVNGSYTAKGTVPDDFFLGTHEDGFRDRYRGLEIFFVAADRLYMNMTWNGRFISGAGAGMLRESFLKSLQRLTQTEREKGSYGKQTGQRT